MGLGLGTENRLEVLPWAVPKLLSPLCLTLPLTSATEPSVQGLPEHRARVPTVA